jgi:PAS domain S-box-containing protein
MRSDEINHFLVDSPYAWWEWDIIANKVTFNDLKATMLGYNPYDFRNSGYQVFTDLLHVDDFEKTMQAMRDVLEGKTDLYQIDYRIKAKNGSYHWYLDRGLVIEREESEIIKKLRGIVIDLGAEKSPESSIETLINLFHNVDHKGKDSVLTICSSCQKAKANDKEWIQISKSIEKLLGGNISHGICPDCIMRLYPEYAASILKNS